MKTLIVGYCPQINYLIHGHAFIDNAIETRETTEVIEIIGNNNLEL